MFRSFLNQTIKVLHTLVGKPQGIIIEIIMSKYPKQKFLQQVFKSKSFLVDLPVYPTTTTMQIYAAK